MDREQAIRLTREALVFAGVDAGETLDEMISEVKRLGVGGRDTTYGVGKKMGDQTWVHKSYEHVFPEAALKNAKAKLPGDFSYAVVRYNRKDGSIAFIDCADFDSADEPTVGDSVKVSKSGDVKRTDAPSDPLIWHHKWAFVSDDYSGFDVHDSVMRSIEWKTKLGNDAKMSSRIGRKSVWEDEVVPQLASAAYIPDLKVIDFVTRMSKEEFIANPPQGFEFDKSARYSGHRGWKTIKVARKTGLPVKAASGAGTDKHAVRIPKAIKDELGVREDVVLMSNPSEEQKSMFVKISGPSPKLTTDELVALLSEVDEVAHIAKDQIQGAYERDDKNHWRKILRGANGFISKWKPAIKGHSGERYVSTAGIPSTLYHTSPAKFSQFKQKSQSGPMASDVGFHFGNRDAALHRASQYIKRGGIRAGQPVYLYQVKLGIKKPLRLEENRLGSWSTNSILMEIFEGKNKPREITDEMEDLYWDDVVTLPNGENLKDIINSEAEEIKQLKLWIQKTLGYDGIVYKNKYEGGGDSYVAFSPNQIKIKKIEELEAGVSSSDKVVKSRLVKASLEDVATFYRPLHSKNKGLFYRGVGRGGKGTDIGAFGNGLYVTWSKDMAVAFAQIAGGSTVLTYQLPSNLKLLDSDSPTMTEIKESMGLKPWENGKGAMFSKVMTYEVKSRGYDGVISDQKQEGIVIFDTKKAKLVKKEET